VAAGWLGGLVAGWWVGWLGWLGWLAGWLAGLVGWLVGWLAGWLAGMAGKLVSILDPFCFMSFGTVVIWGVPNTAAGKAILLDFRPENRILTVTMSTISMRQGRSISIFQFLEEGDRE
jgi:hypothetical protein